MLSKIRQRNGPVVQLVRTLACHARGRRFEPVPGRHFADIAQAVERILGKDEVTSSILVISSRKRKTRESVSFLFQLNPPLRVG